MIFSLYIVDVFLKVASWKIGLRCGLCKFFHSLQKTKAAGERRLSGGGILRFRGFV